MLKYHKQTRILMTGKNQGEKRTYATLRAKGKCSFHQLADHISDRYKINRGDCYRFMEALALGIYDQLAAGNTIEAGSLGNFRLTLKCDPSENPESFTARQIKEVNLRFTPSKEMKQKLKEIRIQAR